MVQLNTHLAQYYCKMKMCNFPSTSFVAFPQLFSVFLSTPGPFQVFQSSDHSVKRTHSDTAR